MKNKVIIGVAVLSIVALAVIFGVRRLGNEGPAKEQAVPAAPAPAPEAPQAEEAQPQAAPVEVEIPLDKQQMIGVKTAEAAVVPLSRTIRTVGRIEYDERRLSTVNVKFEGWIEKLYVDYTGRYVKKGEPLAELYSPELIATQQEFINLVKWRSGEPGTPLGRMLAGDAEAITEAARRRLRLWDISEAQIEAIEESGSPIRTLVLYAPASGYVTEKNALLGMRVMPGEKLFDIADLSTVWVLAEVYEYEVSLVKVGQKATVSLSSMPGKKFASKVDYIYPTLSGTTRTARVRLSLPNPGLALKPKMFADVEMKVDLGRRLAVPDEAVIDTGVKKVAYVDIGDGYFEAREISTGLKAEGMVEVLNGVSAGEKVASSANFLIDSEARLRGLVQ